MSTNTITVNRPAVLSLSSLIVFTCSSAGLAVFNVELLLDVIVDVRVVVEAPAVVGLLTALHADFCLTAPSTLAALAHASTSTSGSQRTVW